MLNSASKASEPRMSFTRPGDYSHQPFRISSPFSMRGPKDYASWTPPQSILSARHPTGARLVKWQRPSKSPALNLEDVPEGDVTYHALRIAPTRPLRSAIWSGGLAVALRVRVH